MKGMGSYLSISMVFSLPVSVMPWFTFIKSLYDIVKPHIISFHKIYAHLRSKGKFEQWSERSERNCSNFRRTAPKCDIISLNTVDFLFCPAA